MVNNNQMNWEDFNRFFANFNPYQYSQNTIGQGVGPYIDELMKGKLFIHTDESDNEFRLDVMLPNEIDFEKIEHKVVTKSRPSGKKYKTLQVKIPKKKKEG